MYVRGFMLRSANVLDTLGRRIIELRRKRGWTQQAFAERMGYSRNYQQRVERGSENLQVESLVGIANALGVSLSELFEPPSRKVVRRPGKPRRDQT